MMLGRDLNEDRLRMLGFHWDGFVVGQERLDIEMDCVFGHGNSLFTRLALGNAAG